MYNPSAFSVSDASQIRSFVEKNSFGILLSQTEREIHDTHTPLFLSDDLKTAYGHIARANSQWKSWESHPDVKIIFHGPHAYVSPRFYVSEFNVPTWNYTAVSIAGIIQIIESPAESLGVIQKLVEKYEDEAGWKLNTEDDRYMKLLDAVVCFRICISKLDAKFKLNQNKKEEDRRSVIAHLQQSTNSGDREVASLMQQLEIS